MFHKSSVSDNMICRDIGRTALRPFVIKASLRETSLGDFLTKLIFLATLKNQFDYGEIELRYRDVRPYSSEVVSIVPGIDRAIPIRWHIPRWARLGLPDTRLWHHIARSIDGNKGSWGSFCDLYPTDWMVNPRALHALPNPVRLKIPAEHEQRLADQLQRLGANPDRWLAVVHYRASTYLTKRKGQLRNGNPSAQLELISHIIERLGGQAVLLGHPELEAFPERANFIDLSRIKDSFLLQAFACSKARFLIAGPSGPLNLGWGFQIPTGLVDASDGVGGWGSCEQVILTHEVTTPEGKRLQNRALFENGLLDYPVLRDKIRAGEPYQVRKNSAEELIAVANHLYDASSRTTGWRTSSTEVGGPKPNHIVWPPQTSENLTFFDERLDLHSSTTVDA